MMMLKKNSRLFRVFAQRAQEAAAPDALDRAPSWR
jgi:hypothetical protein